MLGVMWSHFCPNWLVETGTKVFENIFPFSFLLPTKLFFKNFSFLQSSWLGQKPIPRFFWKHFSKHHFCFSFLLGASIRSAPRVSSRERIKERWVRSTLSATSGYFRF